MAQRVEQLERGQRRWRRVEKKVDATDKKVDSLRVDMAVITPMVKRLTNLISLRTFISVVTAIAAVTAAAVASVNMFHH